MSSFAGFRGSINQWFIDRGGVVNAPDWLFSIGRCIVRLSALDALLDYFKSELIAIFHSRIFR